jgi:hypothetical protein
MPIIEGTTDLKTVVGEYDFAVDGGAISSITLRGSNAIGNSVPAGSVVLSGYVEVDTLVGAGAGATIGITLEGAGDIVAATVFSGAPWSTTGRKSIIPVGTGAASVKTTVARSLVAVIGTNTVTSGKFRIVVVYR